MSHRIPLVVLFLTICLIVGVSLASVSAAALPARITSSAAGARPLTTYSFTSISTGLNHSCALTSIGTIYCWGLNSTGQLGTGTNVNSSTPVLVKNPVGVTFNSVQANGNHTCAKSTTNELYCWGNNASGQLGIGSTTNKNLPTAVLTPSGVTFASISMGNAHTCGVTGAGAAYCWGINDYGNLGINSTVMRTSPTLVTKPTGVSFASISGGQYHTCARTTTNHAYCWGQNTFGRLGDGTTTTRLVPVAVTMPTGITFAAVSTGGAFSCANSPAGNTYCWGYNNVGQLGIG
ncbi:MAG: RCC1 domain-containing protein, partial [Roseiflexaceae bacterium]